MLPATTRRAAKTYLFLASHDCEGSSPALKTRVGIGGCAGSGTAGKGAWTGSAAASSLCPTGFNSTAGATACSFGGRASVVAAEAGGTTGLRISVAGTSRAGATAVAAPDAAAIEIARDIFSCPRHFFSSHSTQSARPAETGKPQASHFRRSRKAGGTWL
jgi:hypothetical protein